jgi:cellulose synthase/poly-beta-1,6-N-acetylglucosamine synthase-like glycosyltransferase
MRIRNVLSIAAGLTSLYYLGAVGFLRRGLGRLRSASAGAQGGNRFSVLVAAHNEESSIGTCLDALLRQTLGADRYEIIVADDRSTDRTAAIAAEYASRHTHCRLISIERTAPGAGPKKHALREAMSAARHEIIVYTDADCRVPPTWLETIDRQFAPGVGLVQGVTRYERPPEMGLLFFGLQAVDFLSHGIVAAAAIGAGFPLNSNANNLAFRRDAFDSVNGYGAHARLVSGDDDLLVQRIWRSRRWKLRYMTDPGGAVLTEPTSTLRDVFEQRKRWGSKTVHYSAGQTLFLGGIFLFYLTLALCAIASVASRRARRLFAALVAAKMSGEYILMSPGMRLFNQSHLRAFILPASLLQLPTVIAAIFCGVFGSFEWKKTRYAREVKSKRQQNPTCERSRRETRSVPRSAQ